MNPLKTLVYNHNFIVFKKPLSFNLIIETGDGEYYFVKDNVSYMSISPKGLIIQTYKGNNLAIHIDDLFNITLVGNND